MHRRIFADPRGIAGYRQIWKEMVYQITVEKSKGSKLWDVDGNEYIDIAWVLASIYLANLQILLRTL